GKRRIMGFILKTATLSGGEKLLPYLNNTSLALENQVNFEILPKLRKIYEKENKSINFSPIAYKFPQTVPEEYILFEDLQYKGYRCFGQSGGLGSKQIEIVLTNLAAFHAASVTSNKFEMISEKSSRKMPSISDRIFKEHLHIYNLLKYEDTIKSLQTKFLEPQYYFNPQEFQVLSLGNCTLDNMLFHMDAFGNIKDCVFLNIGYCSYDSPAKDLWYILLSSINTDELITKLEYYVKFYYDQLTSFLKQLKLKGTLLKLSDLHYEMMKNNKWDSSVKFVNHDNKVLLTTKSGTNELLSEVVSLVT
ncbi:uncharacterized protein LOC133333592, partial [Musca vetustissima]|uniref:uncharacterized protein LOC133333592 n=1 Tax=Musca vetustissima TaxID=27455 RepID=UPI002AB675B6